MKILNNFPVISQHASWIGINPIQGCPKKCKYCFLQSQNKTGIKPIVLMNEEQTIDKLLESPYYSSSAILSFLTNTDAFSTKQNMEYLKNLLILCDKNKIYNVKTFITKCHIPDDFIELFKELIKKGHKIIVYLSYSGLDNTIERGVSHKSIRENFIRLSKHYIPIIHYWRPFVPQNSEKEKLKEVISFVSQYSTSSVIAGLKVEEKYIDTFDFWPDLIKNKNRALMAEGVWPLGVLEFFEKLKLEGNSYPFYQSNTCAIANALMAPDLNAFNNTSICSFNNCNREQRSLCTKFYESLSFSEKEFMKSMSNLGYKKENVKYKLSDDNEIIINDIEMLVADQAYITQKFHKRVVCKRKKTDLYWNTSVSGCHPLEI